MLRKRFARLLPVAVLVLITLLLVSASNAAVATKIVYIYPGNFFKPQAPAIKVGDSIKWISKSSVTHTATSCAMTAGRTCGSPGADFDTGDISPGATVTLGPFTLPGVYAYHCSKLGHDYMVGAIFVK